jgi:hypothetical protein
VADAAEDGVGPLDEHTHVDGALMVSFGPVHPGREKLAVDMFTELSRFFGERLTAGDIKSFRPFFFGDGALNGVIGFFLLEGRRATLDELRRRPDLLRLLLRTGAATANVRVDTLVAGSEAGRLVNLYREVRQELGLI